MFKRVLSLRTYLVLAGVFALCLPLTLIYLRTPPRIVRRIESLGGDALLNETEGWRAWAQSKGFRRAIRVTFVSVESDKFTDDDMRLVAGAASLERLKVSSNRLTDAGMAALAGHSHLKSVEVRSENLTDAGLAPLADLPHLSTLDVRGSSHITDAGLAPIAVMPKLYELTVLGSNQISGSFLSTGEQRVKITLLTMDSAAMDDEYIDDLAKCDRIVSLNLSGTSVSDRVFTAITELKRLDWVEVEHTNVTEEGIRAFHEVRPDVGIAFTKIKASTPAF